MKIAVANDHAGFPARQIILDTLEKTGHQVIDLGSPDDQAVDYPDYAEKACQAVARGEADRAVLVCGTGQGMAIAANKMPGIRAARCLSARDAELARSHNDSNVLALNGGWGEDSDTLSAIPDIIRVWLETEFLGGKHARRVEKISQLERRS